MGRGDSGFSTFSIIPLLFFSFEAIGNEFQRKLILGGSIREVYFLWSFVFC